jgi:hypothetical protein
MGFGFRSGRCGLDSLSASMLLGSGERRNMTKVEDEAKRMYRGSNNDKSRAERRRGTVGWGSRVGEGAGLVDIWYGATWYAYSTST